VKGNWSNIADLLKFNHQRLKNQKKFGINRVVKILTGTKIPQIHLCRLFNEISRFISNFPAEFERLLTSKKNIYRFFLFLQPHDEFLKLLPTFNEVLVDHSANSQHSLTTLITQDLLLSSVI
jgi:hypothetical protein